MWLQQGGSLANWHNNVRDFLNEQFENQSIERNGPIEWPPRSPDLTSPDYHSWGFLKGVIYYNLA